MLSSLCCRCEHFCHRRTMSEQTACSSFSQHAWKKDLCVNCGRLRSAHADIPTPAKRLSKGKRKNSVDKYGEHFYRKQEGISVECQPPAFQQYMLLNEPVDRMIDGQIRLKTLPWRAVKKVKEVLNLAYFNDRVTGRDFGNQSL